MRACWADLRRFIHRFVEGHEEDILQNAAIVMIPFKESGSHFATGQDAFSVGNIIQFQQFGRYQSHLLEKPGKKQTADKPDGELLCGAGSIFSLPVVIYMIRQPGKLDLS